MFCEGIDLLWYLKFVFCLISLQWSHMGIMQPKSQQLNSLFNSFYGLQRRVYWWPVGSFTKGQLWGKCFCVKTKSCHQLTHWPLGDLNRILIKQFSWGIFCETTPSWMSLDLADNKSTLVQVMAWCRQATSHYLSQVDPDLCHHMASLGSSELNPWD